MENLTFENPIEQPEDVDLVELQAELKTIDDEVDIVYENPTYNIETTNFEMNFAVSDGVFEIRDIALLAEEEEFLEEIIESIEAFTTERNMSLMVTEADQYTEFFQKLGFVDAGDGSLVKE